MDTAVQHVVGCHDFRNLCKMDVANGVVQYDRRIVSASVRVIATDPFHNDTDTASGLLLLIFLFQSHAAKPLQCVEDVTV